MHARPLSLAPRHAGWVRPDRVLALLTEFPAAILVALAAVIQFAGVISRHVFNAPLTWSDELASSLFRWLAMRGAVIALRRDEHMRLTTFIGLMRPRRRAWVEALGIVVVVWFALMLVVPAHAHFVDQRVVMSPVLEWHDGVRVGAIGVGVVLMLVIALARLAERVVLRDAVSCVALIAAPCVALGFMKPLFATLGNLNLLVFFVLLVGVCVVFGLPIAFALGIATLGLQGFLHRVDGTPAGFVLAQPLRAGVGVMRCAKGLDRFKGIYQHTFQHFCLTMPGVQWLNFEQDMGVANFRRSKLTYPPSALIPKYRVRLR